MVNSIKSEDAPACLAIEKSKPNSENYRCGDVVERVADDFKDKCYLCEQKNITDINVEHFVPHRGNRDKMFDWENLFFACSYCNNVKMGDESPLLNCTDKNINILAHFELRIDISKLPEKHFIVQSNYDDAKTRNTAALLYQIYNGKFKPTSLKERGALNLRKSIIQNLIDFDDLVQEYCQDVVSKEYIKKKIKKELQIDSAFTAFKVCLIRSNSELNQEFSQYLPA